MSGFDARRDVPDLDRRRWRLDVVGTVERSLELSAEEIRSFDLETFSEDFACVEGWVAEGLSWRGVRVRELLALAGPTAASEHALVRAADGEYACAFPLERLSAAVLAVDLDGERLPVERGGPARLVPTGADRDCWESVKWVESIEVREAEPAAGDTARDLALSRIE